MTAPGPHRHDTFIREQTALSRPPLVPEVCLHLATEVTPLWQATQDYLESLDLPPPYWAFAWPGGQAAARYLLDTPHMVKSRRVLDFAAGSGIIAIACALSGAASVDAADIDPFARSAIRLNAACNGVPFDGARGRSPGLPLRRHHRHGVGRDRCRRYLL